MAQAVSEYEDKLELIPTLIPPKLTTLRTMIKLKHQQQHLKQKELATLLEIPPCRLF